MATRLEKIKNMTAEQMAQVLIDSNFLDGLEQGQHFCKSDCEWAQSMNNDGPDEKECLRCCVRWLNEEVDLLGSSGGDVMDLIARERQVLDAIKQYHQQHGYSPSYRDIQRLANIKSTATTKHIVNDLTAKGYLLNTPGVARSLRLTEKGQGFNYTKLDVRKVKPELPKRAHKTPQLKKSMLAQAMGLDW